MRNLKNEMVETVEDYIGEFRKIWFYKRYAAREYGI